MSIDWTELERLQRRVDEKPPASSPRFYANEALSEALLEAFPAILSERREMLAKMEEAQQLRESISGYLMAPDPETDSALYDALVAFDKETA